MVVIRTSAPGKLFLLGEYAVLEGAPALLTAVDRRVRVRIEDADGDRWRLNAPGLGIENLSLGSDGTLPSDLDQPTSKKLRVFDAVRQRVAERSGGAPPDGAALSVSIDSSELSLGGHKLGLGASAAVAVALTAALLQARSISADRSSLFALAFDAHRQAQGGVGSGGDVSTAVNGGLLSYSRGATNAPLPRPTALIWPHDLTMMVVVTGDGSSTPELVGRVTEYAKRDPAGHRTDLARLAALAEQAASALASAETFLALASRYFDALATLDAHADAGIISDRHRELHALAAHHGGVFKSSGAGGGDVGLAFAHRGAPARALAAAMSSAKAQIVPLGICAAGVDTDMMFDSGANTARSTRGPV